MNGVEVFAILAIIIIVVIFFGNIVSSIEKNKKIARRNEAIEARKVEEKSEEQRKKELDEYWARIDQERAKAAAQAANSQSLVTQDDNETGEQDVSVSEQRPLYSVVSPELLARAEAEKKAKRLARQRELRKMTPEEKQADRKKKELQKRNKEAKDIFCDQESPIKDYSNLSPEAAERKLERLKERDGWVDDEVYRGLMKIINGHYPVDYIPYEVTHADPAAVESWFRKTYETAEYGISNAVFKEVADILKPYHEAQLLHELESVEPANVVSWMDSKKKDGFFFSDLVYEKMKKKWLSQYE